MQDKVSKYAEQYQTVRATGSATIAAAIRDGGSFLAAIADAYIAADADNRRRLDIAFCDVIAPRLPDAPSAPSVNAWTVGHTITVYAPVGDPEVMVRHAIVRLATRGTIGGWTAYQADGAWVDGDGDTVREPVRAYQVTVGDTGVRQFVDDTVQALADAGEQAGYITSGALGWTVDLDTVRRDRFNAWKVACTIAATIGGKR